MAIPTKKLNISDTEKLYIFEMLIATVTFFY